MVLKAFLPYPSLCMENEGILYCITEGAEENTLACFICNIYLALYKDYYYPFLKMCNNHDVLKVLFRVTYKGKEDRIIVICC